MKERTLTNLYNQCLTWLDGAVLDAYAWPHDIPDDQILERLLAMNPERVSEGHQSKQAEAPG